MLRGALGLGAIVTCCWAAVALAAIAQPARNRTPDSGRLIALGERLFFETALSRNESQSCATCHDPARAFTDPREGRAKLAVSVGDDGESHGDRNTPTLGYVGFSPEFHLSDAGVYKGGQFWDGRAANLRDQAGQPMLNPVEMAMPDKETVAARLAADPAYTAEFEELWGRGTLDDADRTFAAVSEALAAYQQTPEFAPFDSRYDRWLRGEDKFTGEE
ncbi:cytochrome-c peroxidase [uncultured Paracoccus sp.]|uniref:cytochrome-c peroxidase n=1 Tax=uncultured Paracoccus sp. TaxID=189685 RepID=UPI00262C4FA7|nr:cytochrome-c peroxidase [uncultured Paracoccus sp.]